MRWKDRRLTPKFEKCFKFLPGGERQNLGPRLVNFVSSSLMLQTDKLECLFAPSLYEQIFSSKVLREQSS
jgi:hypothetical protein